MRVFPNSRPRLTKALFLGSAAVCLLLLIVFWPHLCWKLESAWLGCGQIHAVPTTAMPEPSLPENWKTCRFGPMEFSLPPELVDRLEIRTSKSMVMLVFDDGARCVAIMVPEIPEDREAVFAEIQKDYELPEEGLGLSRMRLQLAAYQADSEDFRWSMSRKELRWHRWCIRMSPFYRIATGASAEYVLHDDIEGMLDPTPDGKISTFSYQTADDRFAGMVIFTTKGGPLDETFIRRVCQSCKFSEDRMPKPMPRDEKALRALFEVAGETGKHE